MAIVAEVGPVEGQRVACAGHDAGAPGTQRDPWAAPICSLPVPWALEKRTRIVSPPMLMRGNMRMVGLLRATLFGRGPVRAAQVADPVFLRCHGGFPFWGIAEGVGGGGVKGNPDPARMVFGSVSPRPIGE